MFPTFDVPPLHSETVGARRARLEREGTARRSSTATSNSSASGRSAIASIRQATAASSPTESRTAEKSSGFSWFGKSKKGVQEISSLPPLTKTTTIQSQKEPESEPLSSPPPPPLPPPTQAPPPQYQERDRRPSTRSEQFQPSFHQNLEHLERFPPPLRSLPSLPPVIALPAPPSSANLAAQNGLFDAPASNQSFFSRTSSNPTSAFSDRTTSYSDRTTTFSDRTSSSGRTAFSDQTSSSGRTAFSDQTFSSGRTAPSSRSAFSSKSRYNEPLTEDSFNNRRPSYASNVLLEPVERGSRTGSRQGDHVAKVSQGPFARALAKMENAGARIISARLSEEWDGLEDDESFQEVIFEKRLWALTAYQRLTQNKHLQSPAHELLSHCRPDDQRRILNLHGSLADGWMLATRYPTTTVYTVSSTKSAKLPTSYPAPLNHHSLYLPSVSSTSPFPNDYFDAIVSRSVSTILRNDEWARSFFDCMRTLKPGGQIEIMSIDAHMTSEGPQLASWVDEHLTCRLEAYGLSRQASDTVLDTMEIVGLENIRRARVALPAHSPTALTKSAPPPSHTFGAAMPAPSPQDTLDTSRMMYFLGRHFYQDLFATFMNTSRGDEWFWARKDLRDECQRYNTKMVLTIACALKPAHNLASESYLDI